MPRVISARDVRVKKDSTWNSEALSQSFSLRSRRLEVAGERENGRARGRHACLLLARPFFLVPTTSKRLLRRLSKKNGLTVRNIGNTHVALFFAGRREPWERGWENSQHLATPRLVSPQRCRNILVLIITITKFLKLIGHQLWLLVDPRSWPKDGYKIRYLFFTSKTLSES